MTSRLSLALESGAVAVPPEGRIGVFGPGAGEDLSGLPADRVQVVQGFRPDFEAFARRGLDCVPEPTGRYVLSVVFLPRSKPAARARIARAAALTDGEVVIDGRKTDGVDSLLREVRGRGRVGEVISKAHGKIFAVTGGAFGDWEAAPTTVDGGFQTRPGVFSADAPDPGSVALAAALPGRLGTRVADLGAGWGYLTRAILEREGVAQVHLVEADHAALDCARANIADPRAHFHWADATEFGTAGSFDTVVTNPPFHEGRAADPNLGRAFIAAAWRLLRPGGDLWLVANRHLPYEKDLRAAFRDVAETGPNPSYKIFHASHPLKSR